MKNMNKSRRTYAIVKSVLLVFIIIATLIPLGQVLASEQASNKWVLAGSAKVNPNNEITSFAGGGALDWYYPDARYLGKTRDYLVSETSISMKDHEYDRGEYWNVTFTASFTKPPTTLIPGETVSLPVSLSGSGSITNGGGGQSGIIFEYWLNGNSIPGSQQRIDLDFKGVSASPSFVVPSANKGGKLSISAGLWNCAPCNVIWEYKVEEAEAVEETPESVKEDPVPELISEEVKEEEEKEDEEKTIKNPCLEVMTQEEIDKIRSQPGGVTIIEYIRGEAEVFRDGKWTIAKPYMILQPGEAVRTSEGSEVFFIIKKALDEGDEPYIPLTIQQRENHEQLIRNSKAEGLEWLWGAMKAQTVWGQVNFTKYEAERAFLDENSELCTGDYHQTYERERGFIDLIKGGLHAITKGWKNGSIFSVRAGTTICGIRGSEIMVKYSPDAGKVEAYVIEGHMDVTDTKTGEEISLTDNQKLAFADGALGEIQTLSQEEWGALAVVADTTSYKDEMGKGTSTIRDIKENEKQEETKKQIIEDTSKPSVINLKLFLLLIAIIIIGIGGFVGLKKTKK